MGKPSDSLSHPHINDLEEEPKPKDKSGRNGHNSDEKKQENQGQDLCARVQDQISTEHTRYRTTGSDHGNLGIGIKNDMRDTCPQSGKKIKEDKPKRPQIIFDIIPEYPQIEHIPDEMEKPSVQEHGCKQSERRRQPRNIGNGQRCEVGDLIGDRPHAQNIIFQAARREQLIEKHQDV